MKELKEYKEIIHKCSKCGLCQAECPVYHVTGNDCSVSRGMFVMLYGVISGKLKMSPTINKYLNLCLKCGACSKFCPSGIDVVDVISAAKYEYMKNSIFEKIFAYFKRTVIFGFFPKFFGLFVRKTKSMQFEKKVIYFGGCGSNIKGDKNIVALLNGLKVEVINPKFDCCGISSYTNGDLNGFQKYINSFVNIIKKYNTKDVVVACASCEKSLKNYIKYAKDEETAELLKSLNIKNIYSYIRESEIKFKLKKSVDVTFHKPCNIENFSDIYWLLSNTENLNYIEMKEFDKCCGLNGIQNFKEYKIMKEIFEKKRRNILDTNVKYVLTACLGCEFAIKLFSKGNYKVFDLIDFIIKNKV